MGLSIFEKRLNIKNIKVNTHKSYALSINKSVLRKCGFKENDWVRLYPKKGEVLIKKINIKKLLR